MVGKPFGKASSKNLLKVGQKAPGSISESIKNSSFNLDDYRGKKVLLDFSTISYGYCKLALNHFNQKDYQLSDKISVAYINPTDEKEDVIDYVNEITVPFPVIANAEEIGELYGVSIYPTFSLLMN